MPVRRSLPIVLVLLLASLPAHTLAAPAIGGALHGTGTASAFTAYMDGGKSVQGGLAQHTLVCRSCLIRITLADVSVTLVENGATSQLTPGTYEIREFVGTFSWTQRGLRDFAVRIEGEGLVSEVVT